MVLKSKCTQCKKSVPVTLPISVSFGYGSKQDTEHYEFCSDECFEKWKNSNKEYKELQENISKLFNGFFNIDKRDFEKRSEFMMKKYKEMK